MALPLGADDMDPRIKEYFLRQMDQREAQQSPEYRASLSADRTDAEAGKRQNNLAAILMNSASMAGQIGGRRADSSGMDQYAKAENANIDASMQQVEKPQPLDLRLVDYIKSRKGAEQAATTASAKAVADKDEKDRNYKLDERKVKVSEKLANKKDEAPPKMDIDVKKEIETTALKNANIKSSTNLMKSQLVEFQNAKKKDDKIRIGESMLKSLNSLVGADAVGVEEANRLGDALKFQIGNFTGPGEVVGRDLKGFESQALNLINSADNTSKRNENDIDKLYGRPARHVIADPKPRVDKPDTSGQAIAAPEGKQEVDRFYSKSKNQTKIVYSDGTEQVLDGRQ